MDEFVVQVLHGRRVPEKTMYEPAHEITVLITQAISEVSGEPVPPHTLARAFAVHTH